MANQPVPSPDRFIAEKARTGIAQHKRNRLQVTPLCRITSGLLPNKATGLMPIESQYRARTARDWFPRSQRMQFSDMFDNIWMSLANPMQSNMHNQVFTRRKRSAGAA